MSVCGERFTHRKYFAFVCACVRVNYSLMLHNVHIRDMSVYDFSMDNLIISYLSSSVHGVAQSTPRGASFGEIFPEIRVEFTVF